MTEIKDRIKPRDLVNESLDFASEAMDQRDSLRIELENTKALIRGFRSEIVYLKAEIKEIGVSREGWRRNALKYIEELADLQKDNSDLEEDDEEYEPDDDGGHRAENDWDQRDHFREM